MNEHLTAQILEQYHRRALSAEALLAADDHLADCETCRRQLGDERRARGAARRLHAELSAAENNHLAYEQLAAYVKGDIGSVDREIADSHLEFCERCAAELAELRAFAEELAASPVKAYGPETTLPPREGFRARATAWVARLEEAWRSPALWLPVRLASLGLIVGLLFWAAFLRSQNSQLRTALDAERQANEKLLQDSRAANAAVAELRNQLAQGAGNGGPSPSPAMVALNDGGGQVTLDREGNLAGVPPAFQEAVKRALAAERVETPRLLADLAGTSSVLMGSAEEGRPFALLAPVGVAVLSDRPQFRWRALAGADSYVVKVYDEDFQEVAASPRGAGTAWTPTLPLRRGRIYSWQVTARVGDRDVASPSRPAPEAKFQVLSQAKADDLAKAKNAAANSHLTLGVLYAQAGMLDEAERELQELRRANPRSALAEKLSRSLRAKSRP